MYGAKKPEYLLVSGVSLLDGCVIAAALFCDDVDCFSAVGADDGC